MLVTPGAGGIVASSRPCDVYSLLLERQIGKSAFLGNTFVRVPMSCTVRCSLLRNVAQCFVGNGGIPVGRWPFESSISFKSAYSLCHFTSLSITVTPKRHQHSLYILYCVTSASKSKSDTLSQYPDFDCWYRRLTTAIR